VYEKTSQHLKSVPKHCLISKCTIVWGSGEWLRFVSGWPTTECSFLGNISVCFLPRLLTMRFNSGMRRGSTYTTILTPSLTSASLGRRMVLTVCRWIVLDLGINYIGTGMRNLACKLSIWAVLPFQYTLAKINSQVLCLLCGLFPMCVSQTPSATSSWM